MHIVTSGPCQGPNHGNADALPQGDRIWRAGFLLSLSQYVPDEPETHLVFCSAHCFCDWHGAYTALAVDREDDPDFDIPGAFRLIWCSPAVSTVGLYPDWDSLTEQVGVYQKRVLKFKDATERATFHPPYEA